MYIRNISEFICENCTWGRHCDESNPAPFNQWVIPGIIDTNVCLKPMITNRSISYIRFYSHYKNNILPYSGGLLNQPHGYVLAMAVISAEVSNG